MPSLKTTLKILSAVALVAAFSLAVISGPTPVSLNPLGIHDDGANWELKDQLTPTHYEPGEAPTGPSQEEIDLKNAEQLARATQHRFDPDLKSSPIGGISSGQPYDGGDRAELFAEGFETSVPPAGWTTVITNPGYTWYQTTSSSYEGAASAEVVYDPSLTPQDEWLITPAYDLSDGTAWVLDFAWLMSYYWGSDPYDNYDLEVHIRDGEAGAWTLLFTDDDAGVYVNWTWYPESIPLTAYLGYTEAQFGFRYVGSDGAQGNFDAISVNDAAVPIGRCCYGPDFLDCADVTEAECDVLGGHWDGTLDCTTPCPAVPPNDEPEGAIVIVDGETVTGSTAAATIDCPGVLDWEAVWYSFEAPYTETDVYVNYCGTPGDIQTVGIVIYDNVLPLDCGAYIIANSYAFNDCGDGHTNPDMQWDRMPAGSYLFPVYVDDGLKAGMDFSFDFSLTESAPLPPGASCGDPYPAAFATGDPALTIANMTTCGMGNIYENTCLGYYDGGEDWICELSVTGTMTLTLTMDPKGTTWNGFLIADACGDVDPCLNYATGSSGSIKLMTADVTTGTYYIMVDTWPSPDCIPDFDLTIEEFVVTGGDDCSDPVSVKLPDDMTGGAGSDSYINNNYTCGRINDYENTCLGSYDGGEDIIYMLDVGAAMDVDIILDPLGTTWTGFLLADACGDVDPCIATSTAGSGTHGIYNVSLAVGYYYIMVDTWPSPTCIPSFDLTIQPTGGGLANDDYVDCETVYDYTPILFNTNTATFDGPGGCMTSPNIWYCYEATCDGLGTFSLCGSSFDTKLAVYEGTDPFTDPMIGCNDDACGAQSELTVGVAAGQIYLIEVGGYSSYTGAGVIEVWCDECPPPPNDNCEDVTPVVLTSGVPVTFTGNNHCATHQCGFFGGGHVWEAFEIASTSTVTLDYCGSVPAFGNAWLNLAIGCPCTDFTFAGTYEFSSCGDGNVTITWNDLPGGTYYYPVMNDPGNNADGPYTLHVVATALSVLSVSPGSIDFGAHAEGDTGTEPVTLTASGGTSDINFTVSYSYSTKGDLPGGYAQLGITDDLPIKGDYTGEPYVNPNLKQGGDDIASATVISAIPAYETGTTSGYNNDYDEVCPYTGSTAPDVVYEYTPSAGIIVDISLCDSDYDTKLYLYENTYTPGAPFACNDDGCPGYRSFLGELALTGGNTYYIVVDGYGTEEGDYILEITEFEEAEPFECPPGASTENEPCGDDTNGGCNMTVPYFEPINCGDTVCGWVWADGGTRDTDWYKVDLYAQIELSMSATANFPFVIGFVDTSDCSMASSLDPYAVGNPGEIQTCSRTAGPGTYWAFVSHQDYYDYPCGTENEYWMTVTCPEGPVLWLSADPESGTVAADGTFPVDINFDATGLEDGVYNAEVNFNHDGGKATLALPVQIEIGAGVDPYIVATPSAVDFGTVLEGSAGSTPLTLSNGGSGSINFGIGLDYGAKDLTGTVMYSTGFYQPGLTMDIPVSVDMYSVGWDWIVYADVTFPAGCTINGATDISGVGTLQWTGPTGALSTYWGDPAYPAGGYGYLDVGTSSGTVNVTFDGGLTGDLSVDYYIYCDEYSGTPPYDAAGSFLLPLWIDPATNWLTVAPLSGTVPPDAPLTVSYDATDLPAGTYTCDIVITDDLRGVTLVPVTIAVYEWDNMALDPDPVLAIEQNATNPRYGYVHLGDNYAGTGYLAANVLPGPGMATVNANGTPLVGNVTFAGSHPLVFGPTAVVEFDLRAFAAAYGWPDGLSEVSYAVLLTDAGAGPVSVSDNFLLAGHVSGDLTMDGQIDISDLIMFVTYAFQDGDAPQVMETMNVNGDEFAGDIADIVYLVMYMFQDGPAPVYAE